MIPAGHARPPETVRMAKRKIDCGSSRARYCRERQMAPSKCARGSFRVVKSGKALITICCPKGPRHWVRGKCLVGTRAQTILRLKSSPKCNVCRVKRKGK
jgi:hypothetical protein